MKDFIGLGEPLLLKCKEPQKKNPKKEDLKILNLFGKTRSSNILLVNAQEFEYTKIERRTRESSPEKIALREIYRKIRNPLNTQKFKLLEFTVLANGIETNIRLIKEQEIIKGREKGYTYMYIRVAQVSIKLLATDAIDCSVLCLLQDNR